MVSAVRRYLRRRAEGERVEHERRLTAACRYCGQLDLYTEAKLSEPTWDGHEDAGPVCSGCMPEAREQRERKRKRRAELGEARRAHGSDLARKVFDRSRGRGR